MSIRPTIKAIAFPAVIAGLVALGTASPSMGQAGGYYGPSTYGAVAKCNLSGVNPAAHPEIFGNPAIAATYGFMRSANGSWHVAPGCQRGAASAAPAAAVLAAQGKPIAGVGEPVKGGAGPDKMIVSNDLCWVQNGGTLYRWGLCPSHH
jgi:hypothetical protein